MDLTRDPNIDPSVFAERSAQFFATYNIPPFTNAEEAVSLAFIMDTLVDALVDTMQKQDLSYTPETIVIFGSPLGEAMRMIFQANWTYSTNQERWILSSIMPDGSRLEMNPFNKLEKRIENGMEDSITYYVQGMAKLIAGQVGLDS